jgi:type 2 lantibiotic biosynthesis protein LanM
VLDCGYYGCVEYVAAGGCASAEGLRRFYERQGGLLALLYALEAVDFHCENLIAAGEDPVLIDLEALFHPRLAQAGHPAADEMARDVFEHSVLRVGLLPQRLLPSAESAGVDLSGLGGTGGQLTPQPVPCWEGAGTDGMRLVLKRLPMPGSQNRPTLGGREASPLDYPDAVTEGFTRIYALLLKHRNELLGCGGPLAPFAEDEVRVILRPTRCYAALLRESFHPDVLRDALDRDRLLDHLWAAAEQFPYLARAIPAERDDLLNGDVPMFLTCPGSRDLWTSSGTRLASFFPEPGMASVQRRVRQLSDKDLAQQLWFIRASLSTLSEGAEQPTRLNYHLTGSQDLLDPAQSLATACKVGDHLEALARRSGPGATWVGLTLIKGDVWSPCLSGLDLYDGLPGIALFLAYLGALTGEGRYTNLAQAALFTARRALEQGRSGITSVGAFDGWGGVIYALAHLATLWAQPSLLADAQALVEGLPALTDQDERLDLISGAAGCIGSLLALYRCAPSAPTLEAAVRCGDRLLSRARATEHGIAWDTHLRAKKPLTGFSHGAAGMAWALGELGAQAGEKRFTEAAEAALAYERGLFSAQEGNWPDFRAREPTGPGAGNDPEPYRVMWCHGAPGIGLSRLRLLPHAEGSRAREEVRRAVATTLAHGLGSNHSLCHGDLGNLEFLALASEQLEDEGWRSPVARMTSTVVRHLDREGWHCGNPLGVESPGLMTGLAGIGYGLLLLACPARVPCVLLLDPPTRPEEAPGSRADGLGPARQRR